MIIGITGYNGAGKSTVAKIIARLSGFEYMSAREYLLSQFKTGTEPSRLQMIELANHIRFKEGPTGLFQRMMNSVRNDSNIVIESVRCPGEIDVLLSSGGCLIGVNAPVETRYERVLLRGSSTDSVTFEQFIAEEKIESTCDDPLKQNIRACMERAFITIANNFSSESELEFHVGRILRINNFI